MSGESHKIERRPLAGDDEPVQIVLGETYALKTIGDASASSSAVLKTTSSLGAMTYALRVNVVDASGAAIGTGEFYLPLYAEA